MKKLLYLAFPVRLTGEPITYNLIVKYSLRVNILRATIDYNIQGNLLIELDGDDTQIAKAIDYLDKEGVEVTEYDSSICIDKDSCVNCGACTAVCEVGALSLNNQWVLELDSNKCLGCKLCVRACPTRSITTVV